MIPISRGSRQVVMVGDQCQLPATVISAEAQKRGLDVSLFERMLTLGMEVGPGHVETGGGVEGGFLFFPL